jgi:hypothetical protein
VDHDTEPRRTTPARCPAGVRQSPRVVDPLVAAMTAAVRFDRLLADTEPDPIDVVAMNVRR